MNEHFRDSRTVAAEEAAFEAEQLEHKGQTREAAEMWQRAASLFREVSLECGEGYPNTRRDLARAADAADARALQGAIEARGRS